MPNTGQSSLAFLVRVFDAPMISDALLFFTIFALAWFAPSAGKSIHRWINQTVLRHLDSPVRQIAAVGLLAILARASFLPWLGSAVPQYHDEFSLLLQAQTYLAGRLINPTPFLWQHFEEIHINLVPAYGSMYFPGRSLPLATGLLLVGNAWVGVWLSFALMAMGTVWMLRGWVSTPLALLGGVLVVLRFGVFSYWVNSFWGGAFTAFGAMLVIGAVPRALVRPSWSLGLALGLGGFILLTTRPYEGALLCMPFALYIGVIMIRRAGFPICSMLWKVGLPAACFAFAGGATLIAHNQATTGHLLTTAYTLNRQAYATTPALLTSPPIVGEQRGPTYFRAFYRWENSEYVQRHSLAAMLQLALQKLYYVFAFHVGPLLAPAFLAGLWASRRDLILPAATTFFLCGFLLETWGFPHYTAPLLPLMLIFTLRGFAWLVNWQVKGREFGAALSRLMPVATALSLVVPALAVSTGWPQIESEQSRKPCCALLQDSFRSRLEAQLEAVPGRDIVLVSSTDRRPSHIPIVYNEPAIANADIIWAHSLNPTSNERLLNRFNGRRVWTLTWDEDGVSSLRQRSKPFH